MDTMQIRQKMDQAGASMGSAYNTLAGIYQAKGELQTAMANSRKAIEYFRQAGDKRYITNTQGRLASIFLIQGQYSQAKTLILENLASREQLQDVPGQISSLLKLQQVYRKEGNLSQAQTDLSRIEAMLTQVNQRSQHNTFHRAHVRLAYINGDYATAKVHLQRIQPQTDGERIATTVLGFDYDWHHQAHEKIETDLNALMQLPEADKQGILTLWKARLAAHKGQDNMATQLLAQAREETIASQQASDIELAFNTSLQHLLKTDPQQGQKLFKEFEQFNPPPYPYYRHKAMILSALDQQFAAASLMQELKTRAAELWRVEDETLLLQYQDKL